jgi:AraC family transcriptional activator of pobA
MKSVKTYRKVKPDIENVGFGVSRMEDIYSVRKGKADEPHRHDYFTVLIVKKAKGKHIIDFNTYPFSPHQIYFVSPGQVHQVVEEESGIGYVMTFSTHFLIENAIPLSFIESLNLFHDYGHSPPLTPTPEQFKKLTVYAEEIFTLYHSDARMKALSIGAYLKLFFIECNTLCAYPPITSNYDLSENHLIGRFKALVNDFFTSEHSTSFYAGQLNISPDHLNRIIKSKIGKTAKEYIQSRISTEAKRLLYFSKLSTKEIGFALGFNEPANFSSFFKKCTHMSPSTFKKTKYVH